MVDKLKDRMTLQTLTNLINRTEFLQGLPIALLIVGLAFLIVAFNERRLTLILLPFIYLFMVLPYSTQLEPFYVSAKLFTGLFVCLILAVAQFQLDTPHRFTGLIVPQSVMMRRIGISVGATVLLTILASIPRLVLPILPETAVYLNIIIWLLTGLGAIGIWFSRNAFSGGIGLLLFLAGFELYHSHINQSQSTMLILAAINLSVALLIAYLMQAPPPQMQVQNSQ